MTTSATDQIDPVPEQTPGSVSAPNADAQAEELPPPSPTVESVTRKHNLFSRTMVALQEAAFSPQAEKVFSRRWRIGQVADMVGRSSQSVRNRVAEGVVTPEKSPTATQNLFTLEQINTLRDVFGTRAGRAETDPPAIVAYASLKGGCGKTQMSVHFAQYLALKSYRVLFVDLDPQGSATTLFGLNPDLDPARFQRIIEEQDDTGDAAEHAPPSYTLDSYFFGDFDEFANCVQASYFPGIDLVPASMALGQAEYYLAKRVADEKQIYDYNRHPLNRLRNGIYSVASDYDVIVLDPPPALGLLSLSVLNAANALVIPLQPTVIDFASTAKFMEMLGDNLYGMQVKGFDVEYDFEALLVNNLDEGKSAHVEITDAMRSMFSPEDMLVAMMKDSAEIDSASKEMMTVYDLSGPMTNWDTYKRAITYLDRVNAEIETRVRRMWPSHKEQLRKEAQI
jgi:chromosome partitioning protein